MKVSIITTVMNSAHTLEDTIVSVRNQDYSDIQHIFIDGQSTDGSSDIIKKYLHPGDVFISERDHGIYDAMNKGLSIAEGEIIGILNSDDLLFDSTVISSIVDAFFQNQCDILYGDLVYFNDGDPTTITRVWESGSYREFASGWHPCHPSFYFSQKAFSTCGMFDTNLEISADFDYMLRCFDIHKLKSYYFNKKLVRMRMGGASGSSLKNIIKGNMNCLKSFKKNGIKVNPLFYLLNRFFMKVRQYR